MRRNDGVRMLGLVLVVVVCGGAAVVQGDDAALRDKCSKEVEKVVACMAYATGKAEAPTKECCDSVTSIKETDPACLCYTIQLVHHGDNTVKSMGIQEARLLQLPSACKLTNASISNCPKLLKLPANSPDAAIFTNTTSTASPTPGTTSPNTASTPSANDSSDGFKDAPQLGGLPLLLSAVAIFFWAFPSVF